MTTATDIDTRLKQAHSEIARLANRIEMKYASGEVEIQEIIKEWKYIAPTVESIECALNGPDCTVLNVKFHKGGELPRHAHEHNQEEIFVVAGQIYDAENDVTIREGDKYVIPKGTWHHIFSDYARLTVVFRPAFPKTSA